MTTTRLWNIRKLPSTSGIALETVIIGHGITIT